LRIQVGEEECHLRILAIDDDRDSREMYARMLRDDGHDAILAVDAVEGLQLLDPTPELACSTSRGPRWTAMRSSGP